MNRITSQTQAEIIGDCLDLLPEPMRARAGCDFFTADPVFAGLHGEEDTGDYLAQAVYDYRSTAHCCYPHHVADRRTTVVLPSGSHGHFTVLHEIGHALREALCARLGDERRLPYVEPVTEYAKVNQDESFAEAFAAWFYFPDQIPTVAFDRASRSFFDELAAT